MAIAHVQSAQNRQNGATAKAFTSNNTAGNLIVLGIVVEHSTDTIASVADSRGNSYAIAGILQGSAGNGYQAAIYYAKNIAAGANTVTVTPTIGTTAVNNFIHEYSGADTTAPLDVTSSATGASAAANSGSATTAVANELIFGVLASNGAITIDASLTGRQNLTFNFFCYTADKIGASAGSYAINGTLSSNRWVANMATFKPAGAAVNGTATPSGVTMGAAAVGSVVGRGGATAFPAGVSSAFALGVVTASGTIVVPSTIGRTRDGSRHAGRVD